MTAALSCDTPLTTSVTRISRASIIEMYPRRAGLTAASFLDLTPVPVLAMQRLDGGVGNLLVIFESDLTPLLAYKVRRRIRTVTAQDEAWEEAAVGAYTLIDDFNATPNANLTNTAVINHVKRLGAIVQGLTQLAFPDAAHDLLGP